MVGVVLSLWSVDKAARPFRCASSSSLLVVASLLVAWLFKVAMWLAVTAVVVVVVKVSDIKVW